jgi:hypothetical protein
MRYVFLASILLVAAPALANPPAWDRKIDSPKRFKVLKAFESAAVLDQETGLVWTRQPAVGDISFGEANTACAALELGARGGWRLPTAQDIRSLIPPVSRALPAGHPFTAPDGAYWTSTFPPGEAVFVQVGNLGGGPKPVNALDTTSDYANQWCVRGGLAGNSD